MVDIATHIKHSVSQIKSLLVIEVKEWSSALIVRVVDSYVQIQKFVKDDSKQIKVNFSSVMSGEQIERSKIVIVRYIRLNFL